MLDTKLMVERQIEFYKKDIDNPNSVNGFRGTWNFSDHHLIPSIFNQLLLRHFGVNRLSRIPLAKINTFLNDLWDGPGSLEKLLWLEYEMRSTHPLKIDILSKQTKKEQKDEEDMDERLFSDLSFENSFDLEEDE